MPRLHDFGARLERARKRAGSPTYAELARRILISSGGEVSVSDQTIANYHRGHTAPDAVRLEVIVFLAEEYGITLDAVDKHIAARYRILTGPRPTADKPRYDHNVAHGGLVRLTA